MGYLDPGLPMQSRWPMDVAVRYKRGHRGLRAPARPSVLGGGLLERARSTTLALLGATTAVGLVVVALAMNQEWPLVAGSSIPRIPPRNQGVGEAEALTKPAQRDNPALASERRGSDGPGSDGGGRGPAASPSPAVVPAGSTQLVVAPSAPATPESAGGDAPAAPAPPPTAPQPQQTAVERADPPPAVPPSSPPSPPADSSPTSPPVAASADTSDESSLPPWSNGKGNAYGRGKSDLDDEAWESEDYDCEDRDWSEDNDDRDRGDRD